ncbi:hypothetical protein BdWA1_003373 [Babesia duncani]|uniref:Uncharacterized protein n=1 Tax=Babesia duncani TaxID=323732 RepID=A0AAD9PIL1_9APIC|nr:hypothetical protein BdWA1_003373 [Babesia duncani]
MARFFSYKKLIAFAIVALASLKEVSFLGGCPYALAVATTTTTGTNGAATGTNGAATGTNDTSKNTSDPNTPATPPSSPESNKDNAAGGSDGQKPTGQDPQKPNAGNGFAATSVIGAATIGLLTLAFN